MSSNPLFKENRLNPLMELFSASPRGLELRAKLTVASSLDPGAVSAETPVSELPPAFVARAPWGLVREGELIEVSGALGSGKTAAVLECLREHRERTSPEKRPWPWILWMEQGFDVYPVAFEQAGLSLEDVAFVDVEAMTPAHFRLLLSLIQSQVFAAVVLKLPVEGAVNLRKLSLACKSARAMGILIHSELTRSEHWPIQTQVHFQNGRFTPFTKGGIAR